MEEFYRLFGERVREAREALGISQHQLSVRVGVSRASVANIERGAQRVALHQWLEFAAALNVDPSSLVPGIGRREEGLQRAIRSERVPAAMAEWIERAVTRRETAASGSGEEDDENKPRDSS